MYRGLEMKHKMERYLKILKIELEDLETDIAFSEELLRQKHDEHKITDYVFMENLSTFRSELLGIKEMENEIDNLVEKYDNLDDLMKDVYKFFQDKVREAGLPEVVFVLIKRKLDKVYQYLTIKIP